MNAPPEKPPLVLFEPEELARLAERARLDVHGGVKGEPSEGVGDEIDDREEEAMRSREHARLVRGLNGLRLAARCYALQRDPAGLTPIVWGTWAIGAGHGFETHTSSDDRIAAAVLRVGARVFEVPGLAEKLGSSDLRAVRHALAKALPAGPASEPILRVLAQDADADVRAAATKKIGALDAWGGAFPIAPDGHPTEVLDAAKAVLERSSWELSQKPREAVRAFAPLSDALAVACWERVLSAEYVGGGALRPWLARLLERPGGGAALARLVTTWDQRGRVLSMPKALDLARKRLPEASRARAFSELCGALRAIEAAERASESRPARPYLRAHIVEHAVMIAPAHGDTRALLETVLGGPVDTADAEAGDWDYASGKLSALFARWVLDDALRATLVHARRAGKPGRWRRAGHELWDRLGPDPFLREKARRELDDEGARGAAVFALLGSQHDRSEDGSVASLARRLYGRPELRAAVLQNAKALRNAKGLLPRARKDLERGRLDLAAAIVVLQKTPREEQSDAMWAAARALRDRALAEADGLGSIPFVTVEALIRVDAWDPSDLAFARAVAEHALTGEREGGYLRFLIGVLESIDAPESAELLREIDARATTDELREEVRAGRELSALLRRK